MLGGEPGQTEAGGAAVAEGDGGAPAGVAVSGGDALVLGGEEPRAVAAAAGGEGEAAAAGQDAGSELVLDAAAREAQGRLREGGLLRPAGRAGRAVAEVEAAAWAERRGALGGGVGPAVLTRLLAAMAQVRAAGGVGCARAGRPCRCR